jgi:tight adherence protein C
MAGLIKSMIESDAFSITVLVFAFLCGATFFYISYTFLVPSLDIRRRLGSADPIGREALRLASTNADRTQNRVREAIETYYRSIEDEKETSLRRRLVRAGFFAPSAMRTFNLVRIVGAVIAFAAIMLILPEVLPSFLYSQVLLFAVGAAGLFFIIPNFVLDRLGNAQEDRYRRGFPDFMDMMIMCADAGLSLEASVTKVAQEFLLSHRELGIHLNIMMLEVRAGKRLREALQAFADRIDIEEARSLSVLFKQSEELGASITQTLRVFSEEMRNARIVRAEEKGNMLPVKMLLPLGVFMFPVMLVVVALSPLLAILKTLTSTAPF